MTSIRQRLLEIFEVEYREHLEAVRAILAAADAAPPSPAALSEATRRAHSLKGAARAVGLDDVEGLAHGLETLFIKAKAGEVALDRDIVRQITDALDEIEDRVVASQATTAPAQRGVDESEAEPERAAAPKAVSVRIGAVHLDDLFKSANELHADMLGQRRGAAEARAIGAQAAAIEVGWARFWGRLGPHVREAANGSRSPDLAGTADDIATQIRGLVKQAQGVVERQERSVVSLRNNLLRLNNRVKAAGMLSAASVFGGFRKMVRDIARAEGKQVEAIVEGLDCEADRLVLQQIKDPVMHLLRNAVSHGIEPPEERRAKGKAAEGRVRLVVSTERNRLSIIVEDDGRGVDFAEVATQAAARGLLSREEADFASRERLSQLLFAPGFSTAAAVTRISGRGVGLSVARETAHELDGTIALEARPGGGTRIEMSLPLSVLSRRLLLVTFREQSFAIPCDAVAKAMRVPLAAIVTVEERPTISFGGVNIPLRSLGELLDPPDAAVTTEAASICVAVLRGPSGMTGLAVEGFAGVGDFPVRKLEAATGERRLWSGLITTPDGDPCLVLGAGALAHIGGATRSGALVFNPRERPVNQAPQVLVVDDFITTRTLEKSILEAEGYRVRLSVDGLDAIAQLRAEPADVVVSDIEMPRLDGFELLRSMKADEKLAEIPVILVTSREDPADRERGLRLGADAYVVKQRFDQVSLLKTIRQVI